MIERKCVKFRVDMYADTKFKVIDMKPERDVIHYIWSRILLLAGKVNLEGDLYFSKNIPYTIETLAIEFNRDNAQVKLALDLFIELEMIELTKGKIYRVKNFAKHQNIKVKEKHRNKVEDVQSIYVPQIQEIKKEIDEDKNKNSDNRIIGSEADNVTSVKVENLEITEKDIVTAASSIEDEKCLDKLKRDIPIIRETNKSRKGNRKKNEIIDVFDIPEGNDDDSICCISKGVRPMRTGENSISEWSFG